MKFAQVILSLMAVFSLSIAEEVVTEGTTTESVAQTAAPVPVKKENIAILNLDPIQITPQEAQILTKKLSSELVKLGKFTVLDRGEMEAILQEQGFQQTGCTSSECAVEVGQLLGVSKIIAGSVGKLGAIYYVEVRMIDVQSSKIDKTVDHNQGGSIENVLTISLPYIASKLADITIAEPVSTNDDSTLFVAVASQKEVADSLPVIKPREIILKSHHNRGTIFMNDSIIGKDAVTVTVTNTPVKLHEKKWFYESKPETVNLAEKKGKVFGVGGNAKDAYLSAGYFSARNGDEKSTFPAGRLSIGALHQSANLNEFSVIVGQLEGLQEVSEKPQSSQGDNSVQAVIGGFYEWNTDLALGEFFKAGLGFSAGFLTVKDMNKSVSQRPLLREDLIYKSFGGPKVRIALGYKKFFVESQVSFQMGVQEKTYRQADLMLNKWITPMLPEYSKNSNEFKTVPMISFNAILIL